MLPVVVFVLPLSIVLLLIATVLIAVRRKLRQSHTQATAENALSQSQQNTLALVVPTQNTLIVGTQPLPEPAVTLPSTWYSNMRTLVSLSFLLMLLLGLFVQSGLADGAIHSLSHDFSLLSALQAPAAATDLHTAAHITVPVNASKALVRISQLDPAQYASRAEFDTWAYSACSTASMTEVFNAYGRHYRITDVLKVEAAIGAITPSQGLLDPSGIAQTADKFGFKTTWKNNWGLDEIINIANSGHPVIISFPPDRYEGGHLLVLRGGDSTNVYLADTSLWNRTVLTRGQFLNWWEGYGAVVTPN